MASPKSNKTKKFEVFEIVYDASALWNPENTFLSGCQISGLVRFNPKRDLDIRAIHVWAHGKVHVEWKDKRSLKGVGLDTSLTLHFETEDSFYKDYYQIWSIADDTDTVAEFKTFPKNVEHTFQFELKLPYDLPSSFSDIITYQCIVFLECEKKVYETKTEFLLLQDINLRIFDAQEINKAAKKFAQFRHLFGGMLSVKLELAKRWFIHGEKIATKLELVNRSTVKLESMSITLCQHCKLLGKGKELQVLGENVSTRIIAQKNVGRLRAGETISSSFGITVPLNIPVTSAPSADRPVEITYYLQVGSGVWVEFIDMCTGQSTMLTNLFVDADGGSVFLSQPIIIGCKGFDNELPSYSEIMNNV